MIVLVLGLALIAVGVVDLLWTVVAAGSGGGPITARIAGGLWRLSLAGARRRRGGRVLEVAGVVIVLALLLVWVAMMLGGWWLVFSSSDGAVRNAMTMEPADLVDRFYFAGYTMFTLGLGDYAPGSGWWQVLTVATNGSGLVLLTLAVTYLVPVASAVSQRRQLASYVASLGDSGEGIVAGAWTGSGFGALEQHLTALAPMVSQTAQRHLAYPVLHYFHSREPSSAAAPQVRALSDALLLLRHGVAPHVRLSPAATDPLDRSVGAYLETLDGAFIRAVTTPTSPPGRAVIAAAGVPIADESAWACAVEAAEPRRRLVAGLLEEDGWPQQAGAPAPRAEPPAG